MSLGPARIGLWGTGTEYKRKAVAFLAAYDATTCRVLLLNRNINSAESEVECIYEAADFES